MKKNQPFQEFQKLQQYLAQGGALKSSIEYFEPIYKLYQSFLINDHQQNHQQNLVPAFNFQFDFRLPAGDVLIIKNEVKLIDQQSINYLAVHIQAKINQELNVNRLEKILASLPKCNHEYIKLLTPQQINQAYLFNISLLADSQNMLIEHYLVPDMQKVALEKWLWLLDYLYQRLGV